MHYGCLHSCPKLTNLKPVQSASWAWSPSHTHYGKWLHTRNANHDMSLKWLKSCCVWAVLLVQCLHEEISTTVHSAICDVTYNYVAIRQIAETHLIIHVHAANVFNLSRLHFWSHAHRHISMRLFKIYGKWSAQTNKQTNTQTNKQTSEQESVQIHTHNAVMLVWGSLKLAQTKLVSCPDPSPKKHKEVRGSGVLSDISCHMGRGLQCKKCLIYILHPGLEFSDDLDCCTVWFTKAW